MAHRRLKKRFTMAAGRFAMAGVMKVADRLNPGRIDWWGKRLGDLMFFGSRRYRTVASKNLTNAFPDWDRGRVMRVARDTFRSFARGALEFFHLLHLPAEELGDWITIEGTEHLDAALAKGHGVILITAHFGNWEVFARKLVLLGYPVNVIARDSDDPGMTGIGNAVRQSGGYRVLPRDDAALPAMRCLRKNELLGILPDQNTWSGIFVDFFGRPVATATGPAVFALRSGAPIVCGFARRDESGRFGAVIYPPLEVSMSGDEDTDIQRLTEAFTDVIEDEIRKYPEQWLWVHDRWRRTDEAPDRKAVLEKIS